VQSKARRNQPNLLHETKTKPDMLKNGEQAESVVGRVRRPPGNGSFPSGITQGMRNLHPGPGGHSPGKPGKPRTWNSQGI